MRCSKRLKPQSGIASDYDGPSDVLDHASSETASGSKLGIDATKENGRRMFQTPLSVAHQDGCCGEGEGGTITPSKIMTNCLQIPDERRTTRLSTQDIIA